MSYVSFDGGTFALEDVQENPARYVRQLERAKITPGYAECLCARLAKPLQLVIRRYGSLLHLAGWPEDGHRHAPKCAFYKDPDAEKSRSGGDTRAAIVATATGLNAKLDITLTQREAQSGSRGTSASGGSRSSRRSASLLAFLQTLWLTSGLNRWNGLSTVRHWGVCNAQMLAELGDAVINGNSAQNVLHVMQRYQEAERAEINAEFDAFLVGLAPANGVTRRGIIIGEINELAPTQYGQSLTLRQSSRKYYASTALIDHAAKTYPYAWRALGDPAARIVAILLVERTPKGHIRVVDVAAMLCCRSFIACDSIHEVAMANRLVAEHRVFDKPVRIADDDDMLPDFILRDAGEPVHIEVYGMNGQPAYELRKERKRAVRVERGIRAAEWDVDRIALAQVSLPPATAAHRLDMAVARRQT